MTQNSEHYQNRPFLGICPKHYCFHWLPPKGKADLSGKVYNSFEEAVAQSEMVTFLHGDCAAPFGHCRRDPNQEGGGERYEPHNSMLRDAGLPELFFCDPSVLTVDLRNTNTIQHRDRYRQIIPESDCQL